jgi:hypothetical protein
MQEGHPPKALERSSECSMNGNSVRSYKGVLPKIVRAAVSTVRALKLEYLGVLLEA